MKKTVFFLLVLFSIFTVCAFATDKNSDEYYQSFIEKFRLYQTQKEPYNTVKSRYLGYQTVSSRAEYLDQTKKLLTSQIEAEEVYTQLIRSRLVEATSVLNYNENVYFIRLDDELTYLGLAKKQLPEIASVSELLVFWKTLDGHVVSISNYGYAIKSYIEVISAEKIYENIKITKGKVNDYLSEAPADSGFVKAAKDKFSLSDQEFNKATVMLKDVKSVQSQMSGKNGGSGEAARVRSNVNSLIDLLNKIIVDYQNIILSLYQK